MVRDDFIPNGDESADCYVRINIPPKPPSESQFGPVCIKDEVSLKSTINAEEYGKFMNDNYCPLTGISID